MTCRCLDQLRTNIENDGIVCTNDNLAFPNPFLSLRGLKRGAAAYYYKHRKLIHELLWLLCLRSPTILECYLQEVAALDTFAQLSQHSRDLVLLSASCFAFLIAGDCR